MALGRRAPRKIFERDARRWEAAATDFKMSKSGWTPLVSLNCRLVQGE